MIARSMNPHRNRWFEEEFNTDHVRLLPEDGQLFVLLTSMGLEGDGCHFCQETEQALRRLNRTLDCLLKKDRTCACLMHSIVLESSIKQRSLCRSNTCRSLTTNLPPDVHYSRPILLQHFPLYRLSDEHCERTPDAMPIEVHPWLCSVSITT